MKKFIWFFFAALLITGIFVQQADSQVSGTIAIPSANYPTIRVAVDSLNAYGVGAGGVTFNVAAGYTDTTSNLTITATGTASNPIVFQKSGSGANPLLLAGVGIGTMDGIIKLSGTDYITFNGIDLMENAANTTTTTQMEWGYAGLKVDAVNGCQNVTIRNCSITLNKTNTATYGIYFNNHTTAAVTQLTVTDFAGTNSSNKIYSNSIQNCYSGIYVSGYADGTTPYAFYDHFNQIGVLGGNIIRNFGGGTVSPSGINTRYQDSLMVHNNDVGGGTGTNAVNYGIQIYYGFNSSINVYNNVVSDTVACLTTATYGFYIYYAGHQGVDNTVIIKRNTVRGMKNTAAGTSCTFYGFYIYYGAAYYQEVDSNRFENNSWGNASGTFTGTIYGIYNYPYTTTPVSGSITKFTNNYNGGNSRTQSAIGSGVHYPLYSYYGGLTVEAYNNIIENDTVRSTGAYYGLYIYNYYATTSTYYNNIIRNIVKTNGSSGIFYGYYVSSGTNTGTFNFYNNSVYNIQVGDAAATLYGYYISGSGAVKNVYGNSVYNLKTSVGGAVYGMYQLNGTTINIYKNNIYNLRTSTGTGYGLYVSSGTTMNIFNNYISDIRVDSLSSNLALAGMYIAAGINNIYYNTVFLKSASHITGLFGTAALHVLTASTVDLRNNIFVNLSTPGTDTGYTVAYRRSTTTIGTHATTSNNNLFYAGTPDTNKLIFYDGTVKLQTLAAYKGLVTPADANSVSENPPFVNPTTTPYDLHLQTTIATQCESGGQTITTPPIVDDFDGNARYPNPGYPAHPSYPPFAPDIGADEFGGIPKDLNPPSIVYTPLLNTSGTSARTLVATITDPSGVPATTPGWPNLYWKINSGAYTAATPSVAGNQFTFTFGGGVVLGDTVSYYICAQDSSVPPNVGAFPSAGASGFTANPPAASTPPTTPSSYLIVQTALAGDYTVGVAMFNMITGKNITFEKIVKKVTKEVPVDEPVVDKPEVKGKEIKKDDAVSISDKVTGKTRLVEVEEITWVPMENGKVYEGELYVKKSEHPEYNYPDGIMGIYATITAAVKDLNLRGVSAATRFLLTDTSYTTGETYPIVVNVQNANMPTATNTVTIKPNTGVNSVIAGNAPSARIFTVVTNYIIIDGSNTTGGTTRNLTITNTSTTSPQVVVIGSTSTTPVTNVTLKNCTIINGANTSSAVIVSSATTPGTAGYFNNITIQNNSFQLAYIALYTIAVVSPGNGSGLLITGNDFNTLTNPVRLVAVYLQGIDGATITNNNIGNMPNTTDASNVTGIWFATATKNSTIMNNNIFMMSTTSGGPRGIAVSSGVSSANVIITGNVIDSLTTAGTTPPYGIYVFSTTTEVSITKNKISRLLNTSASGYGARAINLLTAMTSSSIDVINNFIWSVRATSDASVTYWGIGISVDGAMGGVNVYFNSVNLYGELSGYSSATVHTAFYSSSTSTNLNVRDNIFVNSFNNTNSTTDKSFAINHQGTTAAAFTDINYNDYYASGIAGVLGYLGADKTTLADWKAATGKDSNSVSGDPKFMSPTNLHINPTQISPVSKAGQYIATVPDDIDGNTRTNPPDIGADEYTSAPALVSPPNGALNQPLNVMLNWNPVPFALTYKVQVSTDSLFGTIIKDTTVVPDSALISNLTNNTWYWWRVAAITSGGQGPYSEIWNFFVNPTGLTNNTTEIPKEFRLYDNYPNPFNPTTKIKFDIPRSTFVSIKIYDVVGREIHQLVNRNLEPGAYEYLFNASGFASGIYFYRIEAGDFKAVKKMVLIK